jgi:TRAP-type C4-dicarboxylate transport system permease small subunit
MSTVVAAMPRSTLDWLADAVMRIAGVALIGMVAVETWQVFARYVLNDSPGWTEPVALLLLDLAMSFGAAGAVHSRAHFAFPVAVQASPPRLRRVLQTIAQLVVAAIGAVLAVGGGVLFVDGLSVSMAGARLPQGAPFLPLALGGALIVLFALGGLRREDGP